MTNPKDKPIFHADDFGLPELAEEAAERDALEGQTLEGLLDPYIAEPWEQLRRAELDAHSPSASATGSDGVPDVLDTLAEMMREMSDTMGLPAEVAGAEPGYDTNEAREAEKRAAEAGEDGWSFPPDPRMGRRIAGTRSYEYTGPPVPTTPPPVPRKPGRAPSLLRQEVDAIRADKRSVAEVARAWGISQMTVRRVQQRGAFADIPYQPADEIEREDVTSEVTSTLGASDDEPEAKRRTGRPYKGRTEPLSDNDISHIMLSREGVRELARKFGVSAATVSRLKSRTRKFMPVHMSGPNAGQPMTLQEAIRADPRPDADIAKHYGVLPATVRYLRADANPAHQTIAPQEGVTTHGSEAQTHWGEDAQMPYDGQDDPGDDIGCPQPFDDGGEEDV